MVPIRLPPLRARREDIPELARHFLDKAASEGLPRKTTFTIQLKSTDDATQVDPGGGADDTGGSGWDFEPWDWWLGEE